MIRGVLFDMDGVILDSERVGRDILLNECHACGYPQANEALYERLLGVTADSDRALMLEALGDDFPFERVHEAYSSAMRSLAVSGQMALKGGFVECVDGLQKRGMRIALATSTSRRSVENYIAHIPAMQNVFDATVCAREAGRSKPAPDIYLKAADLLGLRPEECIGVEDSRAGLHSVHAAGAVAVMIPDLIPYTSDLAGVVDYRLDSLHALCALIDRLNAGGRQRA